MVAPGFLRNPEVQRWLNGLEPAWTMLDLKSVNALRKEPSRENRAIRLASDLTASEIAESPVARNTLKLLRSALDGGGLKLTATANLSRAVVGEMLKIFEWPHYDNVGALSFNKVVNEPDFLPLHFVRNIAQPALLFRSYRGKLMATRLGKDMLAEDRQRALQAILFHVAFWHVNLANLGRALLNSWPQPDIGVVIWSLSVAASDWQPPEKLTRLCTIPVNAVLETTWDRGSSAMEARILRPSMWFGLLECGSEKNRRPCLAINDFTARRRYSIAFSVSTSGSKPKACRDTDAASDTQEFTSVFGA